MGKYMFVKEYFLKAISGILKEDVKLYISWFQFGNKDILLMKFNNNFQYGEIIRVIRKI